MTELTNKRLFTHNGYSYTISTTHVTDEPLTYTVHINRSHGDPVQYDHVGDRTYAFEEAGYGHAALESDVLLTTLHDYLEATVKRGQEPPQELPDDWMTRR